MAINTNTSHFSTAAVDPRCEVNSSCRGIRFLFDSHPILFAFMTARSISSALIRESFVSGCIATFIVVLWFLSAYGSLFLLPDVKTLPIAVTAAVIVGRSFIHTGLFNLAHDAMHGT